MWGSWTTFADEEKKLETVKWRNGGVEQKEELDKRRSKLAPRCCWGTRDHPGTFCNIY
jgi:hypothetical protein